jgi:predicted DCC family thiol-disulfide oxidoreductase YuxK
MIQFSKIKEPPEKALLVWDGACAFCLYWVNRLKKVTGSEVRYEPFQKIATQFPEIPEETFKRAVQFIDTSGSVFGGAAAVFKVLDYATKGSYLFRLYLKSHSFRKASDFVYEKVSNHRPAAYKVTLALWGKDPYSPKPYWLFYIGMIFIAMKLLKRNKYKSHKSL